MTRLVLGCLVFMLVLAVQAQQVQTSNSQTLIVKIMAGSEKLQIDDPILSHSNIKSANPIISGKSEYLNNVYLIQLDGQADPKEVREALYRTGKVIYAEIPNQESLLTLPNDPLAQPGAGQSHLSVIKAYEAWDITQGDESIVIGISDTGIDFNHQDIKGNIYRNPDEIFNGIDDDGNGYIDDIHGYDFADEDTVAQVDANVHGNQVAGIAGAHTNNGVGIAGVGYKSKISPLKMFTSTGTESIGAYESILYAAEEGYDIVNLSWGSVNTFSQAAQDIINYAVLEKNVVLVAAAGNTNALLDYYPASYDHVLSVGWANLDDSKANNGTYSYNIDLMAPGTSILSTFKNNGYYADVGSSFASPQVAGAAALVKSHFPMLNARQIMEVIRTTTDDIYSLTVNAPYYGKMGSGRLNIYKALTKDTLRSVRAREVEFTNDFGKYAFYGDTIKVDFLLQNYLFPVKDCEVWVSSESPYVNLLEDQLGFDFRDSLETSSFSLDLLTLSENTPANATIPIRLDFQNGGYKDFQYLLLKTSPDYVKMTTSELEILIAGDGGIGFSSSDQTNFGFQYQGQNMVRNLGVMIGNGEDFISDNVFNNPLLRTLDGDFRREKGIKYQHYELTDGFASGTFTDRSKGIKLFQSIYTKEDSLLEGITVLRYQIANISTDTLKDLQIGLFTDWLLVNNTRNRALFDADEDFVYSFDSDSTYFGGLKIYGESNPVHQSIDLNTHNGNTADLLVDLNDSIKYGLMKSTVFQNAGSQGIGNDVAQSISTAPFQLAPNALHDIFFILGSSDTLPLLKVAFQEAEELIAQLKATPETLQTVYSCEGASFKIDPIGGTLFSFYSDAQGANLISKNDTLSTGILSTDTVFYARNADSVYTTPIKRIDIKMIQNVASFSSPMDTLYLDHATSNRISFSDKSFRAIKWKWDFGNGAKASVQNPTVNYTSPGTFNVSLYIENDLGCSDTFTRQLVVARRPSLPKIEDQLVCSGGNATLSDGEKTLRFYTGEADPKPFFRGTSYVLDPVDTDRVFYIAHDSLGFESKRKKVNVVVDPIQAEISYTQKLTEAAPVITVFSKKVFPTYSWTLDGVPQSEDTLSIEVTKSSYELTLKVTNERECTDSTGLTFNFKKSAIPTLPATIQICKGSTYTLKPTGGQLFGFYQDAALTQLISKSSQVVLTNLEQDTSIFVVGLDEVLPSDPVEALIQVAEFLDKITATPPVLYLSESKTAEFEGTNLLSVNRAWSLVGEPVALSASITLFFNQPGIYEVVLKSANSMGCQSLDSMRYAVESVPPLGLGEVSLVLLFPNPSDGDFTLRVTEDKARVRLLDISGKLIRDFGMLRGEAKIRLSGLESGVYVIHSESGAKRHYQRVVIR